MMRKGGKLLRRTSGYDSVLTDVVRLIESARRSAARSVNSVLTTTYWEIGRRIVEEEQCGESRAGYAEELMMRLATDLTARFGRGFGWRNLFQMRAFYLAYRQRGVISSTESFLKTESQKLQTVSAISGRRQPTAPVSGFVLPWSHYVRLVALRSDEARRFYEAEAFRGGWTVRQLDRQIESQFYERTLLSKNKAAMLRRGERPLPGDTVTPEEEIKDPYILEFLGLKDEYSETEAEAALLAKLESFLMELGGDFAFVGRQRRLRVGDAWYRVDLVFFHRTLRCLVIVDLKLGTLTHADSGQMHLYLNYARENWTRPGENPPVGLILCARKDEVLAHYALEGLPNKVLAAEYRTTLPDERVLAEQVARARMGRPRSRRMPEGSGRP